MAALMAATGLVLAWGSRAVAEVPREKTPSFAIPRMSAPPKIDGTIDPVEWRESVAIAGVVDQGNGILLQRPTTFHLAWDTGHLYLACRTYMPPGYKSLVPDGRSPAAYLAELDQGLYGGLVGGQATFMAEPRWGWISSMVPPILSDWVGFEDLHLDRQGEWARRYRDILEAFVQAARGRFGISHFILIDNLNFVFELFGATRTYIELLDRPDMIQRAVDFAFDLNVWVQDRFFETVPLIEGGTCSNMCSWVPGRVVSESVDPFHMTSVDYLRQWGIEPIERILDRYDGGVVHIHGNGRHLLETVCSVRRLRGIALLDDLNIPDAIDVLPSLRIRTGDMPLVVNVPFHKFSSLLKTHRLPGNVLYAVGSVPSRDMANRTMDDVRDYRA